MKPVNADINGVLVMLDDLIVSPHGWSLAAIVGVAHRARAILRELREPPCTTSTGPVQGHAESTQ